MSKSLSKSGLEDLLNFYKPSTEESKPTSSKSELVKKLPKTKEGLKKLKHQLKYQHSQSNVQARKKVKGEEITLLDKLKQKQALEGDKLTKNLATISKNKKKQSETLQKFQDNILNYKVNNPKFKIQKFKKSSKGNDDGFLF